MEYLFLLCLSALSQSNLLKQPGGPVQFFFPNRPLKPLFWFFCLAFVFSVMAADESHARQKNGGSKSTGKSYRQKRASSLPYGAGKGFRSCLIYNSKTGKIIYSHSPDRQIAPASLTKILSIYVAEDAIKNRKLNRHAKVTVSARAAAAGGSRMGLSTGDRVSLDELLRGMAVASGNDASIAVAEYIGGSEQKFVNMMNKKAKSIGMNRSTFKNASGLPAPGQYTTARDMLTLAKSYLKIYPGNLEKYHNKSYNTYKGKFSTNANPLLGAFPGADGLKTGYVNASGYNLVATARRNNQRFIGVILGAPSSSIRATQARSLMEACFTQPNMFAGAAEPEKAVQKKTKKQAPAKKELSASSSKKAGKKATVSAKNTSKKKAVASSSQNARPKKIASGASAKSSSKAVKQAAGKKKQATTTARNTGKGKASRKSTKVLPSSNPTAASKTNKKVSNRDVLVLLPYSAS